MKLKFNKGWALLIDEEGKPITNKTWFEQKGIAFAMSKRYGKKIDLMPVKKAYNLCKSDMKFKKLMIKGWIHNKEIFTKKVNKKLKELIKLPKDTWVGSLYFEDGLASVWSRWSRSVACFVANADGLSDGDSAGFAVFEVK